MHLSGLHQNDCSAVMHAQEEPSDITSNTREFARTLVGEGVGAGVGACKANTPSLVQIVTAFTWFMIK